MGRSLKRINSSHVQKHYSCYILLLLCPGLHVEQVMLVLQCFKMSYFTPPKKGKQLSLSYRWRSHTKQTLNGP